MKVCGHTTSFYLYIIVFTLSIQVNTTKGVNESWLRRILHQPLFLASSAPPPVETPPSPDGGNKPFFHKYPAGAPSTSNTTIANPTATQPTKGTKKVASAISVGIVTLGMVSPLAFFLYKHRAKHHTQKLVAGDGNNNNPNSNNNNNEAATQSSFVYIGTVEHTRSSTTLNDSLDANKPNRSPYHKLNRSYRYRPSPELQPMPPLTKPLDGNYPLAVSSSSDSDEESSETTFHSPQNSSVDGYYTPFSRFPRELCRGHAFRHPRRKYDTSSYPP